MNLTPHLNLRFLQWNSLSITQKKGLLEQVIDNSSINIVLLSETWLRPQQKIHFPNFHFLRVDGKDEYGGVGILIKNNLIFTKIDVTCPLEDFMNTRIQTQVRNSQPLSIFSVYNNLRNKFTCQTWDTVIKKLPKANVKTSIHISIIHPILFFH